MRYHEWKNEAEKIMEKKQIVIAELLSFVCSISLLVLPILAIIQGAAMIFGFSPILYFGCIFIIYILFLWLQFRFYYEFIGQDITKVTLKTRLSYFFQEQWFLLAFGFIAILLVFVFIVLKNL